MQEVLIISNLRNILPKIFTKQITRFSLLQWFFWSSTAAFNGYIVYYLGDIGYSNLMIGTILSVRTFMGIIGQPVLGYICDFFNTSKKVFTISMFFLTLIITPFQLYNKIIMILAMALIGFLWNPQAAILDSWILESSPKLAMNYGFMRAWGSIGFAVMVTIIGFLIRQYNWNVIFWSFGFFSVFILLISFSLKDKPYLFQTNNEQPVDLDINKHKPEQNKKRMNPWILFKNTEYLFILTVTLLVFIPAQVLFIYLAPIIKNLGGTTVDQGYALFVTAISEAPALFLAKRFLRRFKPRPLLLFAACFYAVRITAFYLAGSPQVIIMISILQSLSFGVFLPTLRYYVNLVAPEGLKTTAQGIAATTSFGLGGMAASFFGGLMIDNYGVKVTLYWCMIASSFTVVLLLGSLLISKFGRGAREKRKYAA